MARRMTPHHHGRVHQMWVHDSTYIRLLDEVAYLASVPSLTLSSRVIGWAGEDEPAGAARAGALEHGVCRRATTAVPSSLILRRERAMPGTPNTTPCLRRLPAFKSQQPPRRQSIRQRLRGELS